MSNWREPSERDLGPQYSSSDLRSSKYSYEEKLSEQDLKTTRKVPNSKQDSKSEELFKYILVIFLLLNIFFEIYIVSKLTATNTQINQVQQQISQVQQQISQVQQQLVKIR
ncbi:MAG: hypothetical protein KME30_06755 [Iphinoe sp. HA4291-MV1]|jgi:cell division protein FtsL|nr:hypothetical protein [Iphinoe sp. HA4291-MV1]